MKKRWNVSTLALGTVLMLGLLGAGVALAADPTPTATGSDNTATTQAAVDHQDVFLAKVAKILGIEDTKLTSAITQARTEMIDDAVAAGQMSKAQGEWMKEGITQGYLGKCGFGEGRGHGRMGCLLGERPDAPTAPAAPSE